ncbi:hypothetical protein KGQ72_02345 [Patescibacteria group bacterium]|nr:hypothetical protein [Patescibacteria group bacterium]
MKNIFEHIEHIKGKPHHIRKRVAFSIAAGVSGLIAFIWLAGSLSTGAFAITGSSFGGTSPAVTADTANGNENLAGAAAALENPSAPAHIEIIDAASSTRPVKQEQTVIPF